MTPTKLKQAAGIVDRARQRQRCLRGRGLHVRATATSSSRSRARTPPTSSTPSSARPSCGSASSPVSRSPARPAASQRLPEPVAAASSQASPSAKATRRRRRPTRRPRSRGRPRSPTRSHAHARSALGPATAEPPSQPPTITAKGAPVDDPLAWSQNPGDEWLAEVRRVHLPREGQDAAPVADNPDEPLITCDDKGQKFLLSKAAHRGHRAQVGVLRHPPERRRLGGQPRPSRARRARSSVTPPPL